MVLCESVSILGTYDDCVGTNLFFEEDEERTENENFLKKTPIKLKYVTKQFKILNMQWAKIPEDAVGDVTDDYDVKFKESYETVLKKLEKGALRIEDLEIRKDEDDNGDTEIVTAQPIKTVAVKPKQSAGKRKVKLKKNTNTKIRKFTKHECLMQLAREPLKRLTVEEICKIPPSLKRSYVYNSFKNRLLKENPHFDPFIINYNKNTLENAVDINRCIRQGLIKLPENISRINTETKAVLLNVQNLENLSLPMRYCVLRSHMKKQKRYIQNATEKELQHVTEMGVNVRDSYKIMKVLAADIKKQISLKQEYFEAVLETGGSICVEKDKSIVVDNVESDKDDEMRSECSANE